MLLRGGSLGTTPPGNRSLLMVPSDVWVVYRAVMLRESGFEVDMESSVLLDSGDECLNSGYSSGLMSTPVSFSISVNIWPWCGSTKLHAVPLRPALAVRPMR